MYMIKKLKKQVINSLEIIYHDDKCCQVFHEINLKMPTFLMVECGISWLNKIQWLIEKHRVI